MSSTGVGSLVPTWGAGGGGGGDELCMCHINLSNCFRLLCLPKDFLGAFRIFDGEGGTLAFRCLPFGWKYSPILRQRVLERLMEDTGLTGALILVYLGDVSVVGRGKHSLSTFLPITPR